MLFRSIKGNPQLDFKDQNPIVATIQSFAKLYKSNKPDIASKICWSMYMIEESNPNDNPYARIIDREQRIEEVKKAYYNVNVEAKEYLDIAEEYNTYILTPEESLYRIHIKKFQEMTIFLETLSLDDDKHFDKYYKIMDKLDKMWKGLQMVKENMIDSLNKSKVRGNAQLSAREKRK